MFSLVSFTAIWRHRKQPGKNPEGLRETGGRAGEQAEEYFPQEGLPKGYDPAMANDLSYEDALLDSRVRRFMREEYQRLEPPQGVFQRLMRLIRAEGVQGTQPRESRLTGLFGSVYRVVSGQALSRLVPSGIAVALLVVVGLGSSTSSLMRGGQFQVGANSTPVVERTVDSAYTSAPLREQAPGPQISFEWGVDVTAGEEAYIVVGGRTSMNLPLQTKETRGTDAPTHNRLTLDPF